MFVKQNLKTSPASHFLNSSLSKLYHVRPFFLSIALILMVWFTFGAAVHYDFVKFDDGSYVSQNDYISNGLTWRGVKWSLTHSHVGNWHPITSLVHMLNSQLYGLNPFGHHLTNILFHMANAVLCFLILRSMTRSLWKSFMVAAVFSIHPLRVESVVWISELKDVLSGFFFMLTIAAYIRYVRIGQRVGDGLSDVALAKSGGRRMENGKGRSSLQWLENFQFLQY